LPPFRLLSLRDETSLVIAFTAPLVVRCSSLVLVLQASSLPGLPWPRGTGCPQLPSAGTSTVDHPVGSLSLLSLPSNCSKGPASMVALQNGLMRLRLTLRLEAVEAFLGLGRGFGRLQGPSLLARGFGQRVLGRGRAGRGGLLLWLVALERISIRSHDVGGAEDPPAGAARHIVLGGWRRDATYLGAALADHDNHDGAHYDADNNRSHNADDNSRINSAAAAAAAAASV